MLESQRLRIPVVAITDPRRGRRFSLFLPCCCMSPFLRFDRLTGTTCEMSRTGVLARFSEPGASEAWPQVGETAVLEIDLPSSPNISPRLLRCIVTVVRVLEVEPNQLSVAFELRRVGVKELHKRAPVSTGTVFQMPRAAAPRSLSQEQNLRGRVLKIPVGSVVRVQLKSKENLRGQLGTVSDEGFIVKSVKGSTIEDRRASFDDVISIQQQGKGYCRALCVLVGVGIIFATGIGLAAATGRLGHD